MPNFADAQDTLAARLPGYTRRPHQMATAERIELAIAENKTALINAGCGTGKSLAGLIPAIQSGRRTVVATATKALQDQYRMDLAFLELNLGEPFRWAILKGRANYPCWMKLSEGDNWTFEQRDIIRRLLELDVVTQDTITEAIKAIKITPDTLVVDKEALIGDDDVPDAHWRNMSSTSDECPGASSCPFGNVCMAQLAKERAAEADIVVTNTAYLLQDLMLRQASDNSVALLGEFDLLLVDEAHELPDKATDALSDSIAIQQLERLANDIEAFLHDQDRDYEVGSRLRGAAIVFFQRMQGEFDMANRNNPKKDPVRLPLAKVLSLGPQIEALVDIINEAREQVKAVRGLDPEFDRHEYIARIKLLKRCSTWAGRLIDVLVGEDIVRWLELDSFVMRNGETRERLLLRKAPLWPAKFISSEIFAKFTTIMMSATLSIGRNGFGYMRRQTGATDAIEFDAGSPFDFRTQARLFVPGEQVPAPAGASMGAYRSYAQSVTRQLVEAAHGNALLLFTSRNAMNEAWTALHREFEAMGLRCYKQDDAPAGKLIARLKEGNAVLFGLKTFFVGVDVQGEACRLVIIDKLPFAVPTDVLVSARQQDINTRAHNEWASLNTMTVPEMSLLLIQGVGRLIRHANDKGVMAVLDSRLSSKRYGKTVLGSMPPAPVTTNVGEAMAFLRG